MKKEGYTILNEASAKMEEKKSVFICSIKRIEDERSAMSFINSIKGKYKDATHNVFAYITNNGISMRYSDDGEPQGTAGPPVLEVLKREGLNDTACVVTRYFGGTLLGASGLIRAYSSCCKEGVDAAKKTMRLYGNLIQLKCNYDMYGKILNYIQKINVIIKNTEFLENVTISLLCLERDFPSIKNNIIEMMNGSDEISVKNKMLVFVDDNDRLMNIQI